MQLTFGAALLVLSTQVAFAQGDSTPPVNPWSHRPVCASAFLKADWQLNGKQRVCDWLSNGMFSAGALVSANLGAATTYVTDPEADRGDAYIARFGRRAGQSAFKATGAFVGAWIFRQDPRRHPPFVALELLPKNVGDPPVEPPSGKFWHRTGRALRDNLLAYDCTDDCAKPGNVRRHLSASTIAGAVASGVGGELLLRDRPTSVSRAARASATAYAVGYANAVVGEFTPELTKGFAWLVGVIFRGR